MKKITLTFFFLLMSASFLLAQTKKKYIYINTDSYSVFESGTFNWKANVPYKNFVRFVSELVDVAEGDYAQTMPMQFYEYLVKNYLPDFKKMKLHNTSALASVWDYDSENPNLVRNYEHLFEKEEHSSWQYETILVKGFKYDPKKTTSGPLYEKAKSIMIKGVE